MEVRHAKRYTNATIVKSRLITSSVINAVILRKHQRMDWKDHIISDPEILFGKPSIKGTRIAVDINLEKLSAGETIEYLLTAYPGITREDVLACLQYAAENIRNETIYAA